MPAPADAFAPRMRGDTAAGVHDMKLPALAAVVACNQRLANVAWGAPFAQQFQAVDAVIGIDQRLGRDSANTGGNVRHAGADREEPCRDRDTELAGGAVSGDD